MSVQNAEKQKIMKKIISTSLFLFILIFSTACTTATEVPLTEPTIAIATATLETPPTSIISSPVETPEVVSVSPVVTPTPVPSGKQTVTGSIFLLENGDKKPYVGAILYLAETIIDTNGNESFVALDRINSPRAQANGQGYFVFTNVPEGNYGLILDTVRDSFFLHYPDTGEPILASVTSDTGFEIGELVFDELPLIGQ